MTRDILHQGFRALISVLFITMVFAACSKTSETVTQMKRAQMIVARLDRAEPYFDMHPAFEQVFKFLREENLSELLPGGYDIDGDRLFYKVSKGPGRTRTESRLETHRKYIDIQYVISGVDEMGWRTASECKTVDVPYDKDRDVTYFQDEPESWKEVPAGSFAVFFPQDAHAPLVSDGEIHKVVFKVAVEWPQN